MNKIKNILDWPNANIGIKLLKPIPYKRIFPSLKALAENASATARKRVNDFADWIMKYVPFKTNEVKLLKTALKGFTKSYEVDVINNRDPLQQLIETKKVVGDKLRLVSNEIKGLKATVTLKITFF